MLGRASRLSMSYCLREIAGILIGVSGFFLLLSLLSYCTTDQSFFYYSSNNPSTCNWCGPVGAYLAAFLLYLFGSASFVLVGTIFFCSYLIIWQRPFCQEWDRFIGFGFLLCIFPVLSAFYQIDRPNIIPGGYIGRSLASTFVHWFDCVGALLLMYTFLAAGILLIVRFSFLGFLRHMMTKKSLRRTCYYLSLPCSFALHAISFLIVRPINALFGHLGRLFRGVYIDGYQLQNHASEFELGALTDDIEDVVAVQLDKNGDEDADWEEKDAIKVSPRIIKKEHALCRGQKEKEGYSLPDHAIFIGVNEEKDDKALTRELENRAALLQEKLQRFGVQGSIVSIKRGPVVTLFEYQPDIDSKISKIVALEDDLALALQALSIRIIAPIPGKAVVGFEVANKQRKNVLMSKMIKSKEYRNFSGLLPLILGEDTIGNSCIVDLAKMPHLLVAGSTGSGKSVALNTMLTSLLCNQSPDQLRLILIDPKRLEFAPYADIAHLLFPIVTDPKLAAPVLRWVVKEMEERYEKMAASGTRNIFDYRKTLGKQDEPMPTIVVIIDELADLMMTAGREIEDLIARIAQMARAAGIHMILATQRPSVDVITGLIKVNFPSRISFRVTSKIDSRTILDAAGADKLLGRGDMLFLDSSQTGLQRVHGAFVSDAEIAQVVAHIKKERTVEYLDINTVCPKADDTGEQDDMFDQVCDFLDEVDEVSISLLQRKFRIGYNRSARIIEMLEARGMIAPSCGGKTRKVLR